MPYSSGLNRNIVQCLNDFDIPLMFSHTVVEIKGKGRVSSVVIAAVDEKLNPVKGTEQEIKCDTLLLSVGLLPENELSKMADVALSPVTGGAIVDDDMMTETDGIFACGNVLHVHDLVDFVSEESEWAGARAAAYIAGKKTTGDKVAVEAKDGVRYVVPQYVNREGDGSLKLKMRVGNVFRNVRLCVVCDGEEVYAKRKMIVTPGEMETVTLDEKQTRALKNCKQAVVCLKAVK